MIIKTTRLPNNRGYLKIVAVDPGQSTGIATAVAINEGEGKWDIEFTAETVPYPEVYSKLRYDSLLAADVVLVEDFRVREKEAKSLVGAELWSAKIGGYIEGMTKTDLRESELVYQTPAQAKFVSKHVGRTGVATKTDHEKDALSHIIAYLRN